MCPSLMRNGQDFVSMPRRLLNRCQPDSIREFRAAAKMRFDEGLSLATSGHRMGAVYLWGYTAEMVVKAAYFSLSGLALNDIITWSAHIQPAIAKGIGIGIYWPPQGKGHNVRAWAELLVAERALSPATSYQPALALSVQKHGQRIESLWRETLRYHKNQAYLFEMTQLREATEWFLVHTDQL